MLVVHGGRGTVSKTAMSGFNSSYGLKHRFDGIYGVWLNTPDVKRGE